MTTTTPYTFPERPRRATPAEVAKQVRADLALAFPGVKFSVRSESRGTSSVSIHWNDGPTTDRVDDIVDRYQMGGFDGRDDSYNYRAEREIRAGVEYSVRWMKTQREMSANARTRFTALLMAYRGDLDGKPFYEIENLAWREFVKWDGYADALPETTDDLPSAREWRTR